MDVELTSERPDGTWTWRAAGARQPKGVLDGSLLPGGVGIGDVVRAEADIDIEGITITTVLPVRGQRKAAPRLEVLGSGREEASVTTQWRERGGRGDDADRPPRRSREDRPRGDRPPSARRDARPEGAASSRPSRHRPAGADPSGAERRRSHPRPPRVEEVARPKPKKLRPGRRHRDALMADLPREQQAIAEQMLRGGLPAVRTALEEQNTAARREGKPEAPSAAVLAIAEALLPRVRLADWLDRADAALVDAEEIALADLRSVVVSADDVARDEQTREPAARLRQVLERRTADEQAAWRDDFARSLDSGRVVRALRLSSRSPVPGERLADEAAARLAEAAGKAMTADVAPDRWATLLDAVAYSSVRRSVVPEGVPSEPGEELLAQVRKHAGRVPAIAERFGVEAPAEKPARRGTSPGGRRRRVPAPPSAAPSPPPLRPRRIPPPPTVTPPPAAASPSEASVTAPAQAPAPVAATAPLEATPPDDATAPVDATPATEAASAGVDASPPRPAHVTVPAEADPPPADNADQRRPSEVDGPT